jgi:hypothetical protein
MSGYMRLGGSHFATCLLVLSFTTIDEEEEGGRFGRLIVKNWKKKFKLEIYREA